MNPTTTSPSVTALRDEVAALLIVRGPELGWAVQLCLAEAYNYLDTADPTTPVPATTAPASDTLNAAESTVACVERLRVDALQLIDTGTVADVYALGHAAGELAGALREITTPRPA